jgi:replicative DNA helicase
MEREMKKRLYMEYASGMSMGQIRAKARALHKQGKCGLLLIDYLQLCRESGERGRSREQEVSAMSVEAKRTAMELGIPVILLSQLSREVEKRGGDHRPHLSDLRDSGGIEQDADMVAFVYRPAKYFKEYSDENGKPYGDNYGELIIEKHRSGKTGTVAWRHNESLTRIFDDLPPEGLPPQPHNLPANTNFYESGKEQQSDPF